MNFGMVLKKFHTLVNNHIKDLSNIFPLYFQFPASPGCTALLCILRTAHRHQAGNAFQFINAVTPVGFLIAAAFDVETKPPRFIALHLGLVGLTVQLADRVKYGSIRSRVDRGVRN